MSLRRWGTKTKRKEKKSQGQKPLLTNQKNSKLLIFQIFLLA